MISFREFVGKVGGATEVAVACGVKTDTVYKWWERGRVPPSKAFALLRVAEQHTIPLSTEAVEAWVSEPSSDQAA